MFGQLQAEREAEWQARSQDTAFLQEQERQQTPQPERIYGSLDGVTTPLKGECRELKVVSWYRAEPVSRSKSRRHHAKRVGEQNEIQATDISYATDQVDAESFGKLVWAMGCQRQVENCAEIVFIADGAAWIWHLVEHYYPKATQIVDWYHACQYLAPIAQAAFSDNARAAQAWLEQMRGFVARPDSCSPGCLSRFAGASTRTGPQSLLLLCQQRETHELCPTV